MCSQHQAAFRLAYALPAVQRVAVGAGNPTHLRDLISATTLDVDRKRLSTYRIMKFDGYKLRNEPLDDVFAEVERALGVQLVRSRPTYGTQGATVGLPTTADTWVRVAWRTPEGVHLQAWFGGEAASSIVGVRKPELYRSYRWIDQRRSVVWRADEAEIVSSTAVQSTGVIDHEPDILPTWWNDLKASLAALAEFQTRRVGISQKHVTRRINQVFGDEGVKTEVDEWATAHAELHWGNVTGPEFCLLDWEAWGLGPRGLDAATLWGASLRVPAVADRVQEVFADDLNSRSGLLAQLLVCSNVVRINSGTPTPSPLLEPARHEAKRLLAALR
ncbi:hypothetical protein SAMN04488074_104380 [Lentzea albidocapillata subsp. violacea]|uniref:Phosphotransferase enzyme family protein n=1 Tax=Lentzea albidocapillata subsp. violacea TaxID=128104 RepID=A0A1G8ZK50_9PSEU|nr:hypothetical protein [Lentzea albidocapillata]SDK14974.1 hypothetical protein SAMN04488074_104380 [Lentzea albidocapillata subsp. violacea]